MPTSIDKTSSAVSSESTRESSTPIGGTPADSTPIELKSGDQDAIPKRVTEKSASYNQVEQAGNSDSSTQEVGGRGGLDPVRYGDWEKGGRCIDF